MVEDQTSPLGFPLADVLDPDNDGWFEVKTEIMQDKAAVDRWQAGQTDRKPEPGLVPRVVFTKPPDKRKRR